MTSTIRSTREGYHTCSAYLIVKDTAAALEFYRKAFGAVPLYHLNMPDGKIAHAEFKIGDSIFMIADEYPQREKTSPQKPADTPVELQLYVENVDTTCANAINAGATVVNLPKNQICGDRMGVLTDPFGYRWIIGSFTEEIDQQKHQSQTAASISSDQTNIE